MMAASSGWSSAPFWARNNKGNRMIRRAMRTALELAAILSGAAAALEQPLVAGQAAHARHMELPPVVLPYGSEGIYGDQGSAVNGDHYSPDRRYIVRARIEM